MQDLQCFRHSMQTASEASSPLLDDAASRSVRVTSSFRCHGDHVTAANSVHDGDLPSPSADKTPTDPRSPTVVASVPLAVLEEFSVGATDTEDSPALGDSTARCRRSQFSSSRRSKRPLTTSNGPVSSPPPSVPPGPGPSSTSVPPSSGHLPMLVFGPPSLPVPPGPGPPIDAVIVDMNSNDKDHRASSSPSSRYDGWDRTLDDDDEDTALNDDIGNYDADDAMLEFAERYFNAHPAQFSQSALARTVNIVTRKSLNVSIFAIHFTVILWPKCPR